MRPSPPAASNRSAPTRCAYSTASHWLDQGVPLNTVSLWLEYRKIETTLRYLRLNPDSAGQTASIA